MSFNQQQSKKTLFKALHWLDNQPDNWSEHIKDTGIAVKMYLQSQKNKKSQISENWAKEVSPFLKVEETKLSSPVHQSSMKTEAVEAVEAVEADPDKTEESSVSSNPSNKSKTSSPADWSELLPRKKEDKLLSPNQSFCLDEVSWQTLKKTKTELNLEKEEAALRLLIQLGRKSLESLFP